MAWTSPRTWTSGEVPTAAIFNTHVRDNLKAIGDAWTAWSPTLVATTIGNGSTVSRYMQAGKLVHFRHSVTLGSTSSVSGAQMGFTLPVNAQASNFQSIPLRIYTTGTSFVFGTALIDGAAGYDRAMFFVAAGGWTGTGLATGSHWDVCGTYEAA